MIEEGRILGLDVGDVRTGMAVSDPLGMIATPCGTIHVRSAREDAEAVKQAAAEHEAIRIVVGLPLNKEGGIGPQAQKVLDFIEVLRATTDIEIVTIDERFSTAAAHRAMNHTGLSTKKRKGVIDQAAAQQILQLYLDRERNRRAREA